MQPLVGNVTNYKPRCWIQIYVLTLHIITEFWLMKVMYFQKQIPVYKKKKSVFKNKMHLYIHC